MVCFDMQYEVVLLEPATDFLRNMKGKLQAKAFRAIDLLGHFGPQLMMPHSKKLTGYDLWELRVRQAGMICRLFYFHHGNRIYIVTSGYVKKSEKTSAEEIRRALRLKAEYLGGIT
jgi:phage-related protein